MNITKSMKTIASVSTLCAVLALSSAPAVNASGHDGGFDSSRHFQKGEKHHGKQMMKRMVKALSLTDEQQAKIKAIKEQAKEQHESLRDSIMPFKEQAKTLIHAETFDEQAFGSLQDEYQVSFEEVGLAKAKTRNAIFNVLTTVQQDKWSTLMEKRKQKRANKN